jgi:hypothetical protein
MNRAEYEHRRRWGGWTAPRIAQTEGSAQASNQNVCVPAGSCHYDWTRQLGQLPTLPAELPQPEWWPAVVPWPGANVPIPPAPPELPGGWLSEQECQQREKAIAQAAYAEGQRSESGKIYKTAAVSAAVSVIVGGAVGYFLRR